MLNAARQPCSQQLLGYSSRRLASVLAWGSNIEGQCGLEHLPVVVQPTEVFSLQDYSTAEVHAGRYNSAVVLPEHSGEVWMWGDGRAGKLGHGSTAQSASACRVESLVGRASVKSLALGDCHSIFVDNEGRVWSCGDNNEGQCGLGTPIDIIHKHRRLAQSSFHQHFTQKLASRSTSKPPSPGPSNNSNNSSGSSSGSSSGGSSSSSSSRGGSSGAGGGAGRVMASALGTDVSMGSHARDTHLLMHLKRLMAPTQPKHHTQEQGVILKSAKMSSSWVRQRVGEGSGAVGAASSASMALGFGGFDLPAHLGGTGLAAGQLHTPQRIGRDQHPLFSAYHAAEVEGTMPLLRMVLSSGIEHQHVLAASASRYFTIVATASGEVWTFGACYNGSLGSGSSWSSSAQKVCGPVANALEDNGGAVAVAAGGNFSAALTANGKVVLWGRLPGIDAEERQPFQRSTDLVSSVTATGHRAVVGIIENLPPIKYLAAGHEHCIMSDGERVWSVGRRLGADGKLERICLWDSPEEVLHLPKQGICQLACGPSSSAAVDGAGQLWMWGRLLERQHCASLLKRHSSAHFSSAGLESILHDVDWKWGGFGASLGPKLVTGLPPVSSVALGGWHVLCATK